MMQLLIDLKAKWVKFCIFVSFSQFYSDCPNVFHFRVDERGQNKMTPLHYAARYGKIDSASKSEKTWKAIAFLMKHTTEKCGKDKYGLTHLIYQIFS